MTKPRIQVDAWVIGSFLVGVGILSLLCPAIYMEGTVLRGVLDVVGFVVLIFGVLLRMSARGYKKFASAQGQRLVTEGPYAFVRNPMYLGTFLITIGFILPLYPLWTMVIFAVIFYSRFIVQIDREEIWLKKNFSLEYEQYCQRVAPFIPSLRSFRDFNFQTVFPWAHLWTTKEKYALLYLPFLNIAVEFFQDRLLWGSLDVMPVIINGCLIVVLSVWMLYSVTQLEKDNDA